MSNSYHTLDTNNVYRTSNSTKYIQLQYYRIHTHKTLKVLKSRLNLLDAEWGSAQEIKHQRKEIN